MRPRAGAPQQQNRPGMIGASGAGEGFTVLYIEQRLCQSLFSWFLSGLGEDLARPFGGG